MQTNRQTIQRILLMSLLSHWSLLSPHSFAAGELSFGEDVDFLAKYVEAIVLGDDPAGPQAVIVPAYQGRVMTSTATGQAGISYGWINYEQVATGLVEGAQINVFGGEERFWLGPEGGQFSLFFAPKAKFEFSNWQTPPLIDTDPFQVVEKDAKSVTFRHDTTVTNYAGTRFELSIRRHVELMAAASIEDSLGIDVSGTSAVGYRTTNRLTNAGRQDWSHPSGLLSVWLLGMYKHGPETTVVIPFRRGAVEKLGPLVNDAYFGKVPEERLKIDDGVLFFSGDGQQRGKIGLSPQRATSICGSFDAARNVLTIVKFNQPAPEVTEYVNSMWEIQEQPFAGDVINAYNDGPPEPGAKPLGPFYELETSSPALALKAGESATHLQETFHFEGDLAQLDALSRKLLGVSLERIRAALTTIRK